MKNIAYIYIILLLLTSCGSVKDAGKVLRNEKTNTNDEFLVKKKNPLVLPPNFEEIPEPGSIIKNKESEEEKIKNILKVPKSDNVKKGTSSSIEKSILEKIQK